MPMERAALLMEPVRAMASRRAALPGPIAVASPSKTRRRGCGDTCLVRRKPLLQTLEAALQVGNALGRLLQPDMQAPHGTFCVPRNGRAQLEREGVDLQSLDR